MGTCGPTQAQQVRQQSGSRGPTVRVKDGGRARLSCHSNRLVGTKEWKASSLSHRPTVNNHQTQTALVRNVQMAASSSKIPVF